MTLSKQQKERDKMKISQNKQRVIYGNYQEYLEHQSLRKNVLKEIKPVFDHDDHPWIVEDLKILYRFIKPHHKVLDVGCRSGWSCLRMIHDGYLNVIGIDVQAENIEYGLAIGAPIELGDAHSLKYHDESFDVVFIRSALEHMFDPHKVIEEAYRVLKNNGIIFINVPLEPRGIEDLSTTHSFTFPTKNSLRQMLSAFTTVCFFKDGGQLKYIGVKSMSSSDIAAIRKAFPGRIISLRVHIFLNKLMRMLRLPKQYIQRFLA
jgi:ubiquinone/menaquinone biosynthesis C-methylase UbiE